MEDIGDYCQAHDVKLGVITISHGSAQDVCDKLVESGIEAIWNFVPCSLKVPEGVLLKQENLALSLAYLNNQISK
jgi:redox-sensing transcriptional repressor